METNKLDLAELNRRFPFGAIVTWSHFASLVAEAQTVLVCFCTVTNNPKEPRLGRAIEISKADALKHAEYRQRQHSDDERIYVYAPGICIYFGAR